MMQQLGFGVVGNVSGVVGNVSGVVDGGVGVVEVDVLGVAVIDVFGVVLGHGPGTGIGIGTIFGFSSEEPLFETCNILCRYIFKSYEFVKC